MRCCPEICDKIQELVDEAKRDDSSYQEIAGKWQIFKSVAEKIWRCYKKFFPNVHLILSTYFV